MVVHAFSNAFKGASSRQMSCWLWIGDDHKNPLTCCTELHVFDLDRSEFWGLRPLVLILFGVSFCVSFCILIELCKSESFLKLAWKYNSVLQSATVSSRRATSHQHKKSGSPFCTYMSCDATAVALRVVSAVVEGDRVRIGTAAILLPPQTGTTGEFPGAAPLYSRFVRGRGFVGFVVI